MFRVGLIEGPVLGLYKFREHCHYFNEYRIYLTAILFDHKNL